MWLFMNSLHLFPRFFIRKITSKENEIQKLSSCNQLWNDNELKHFYFIRISFCCGCCEFAEWRCWEEWKHLFGSVNARLNIRSLITHLHSKSLSPIINGLINKAINTKWRSIYEDVQARLEEYMDKIIQSIISSLVDKTAPQDLFEQ